MDFDLDRQRAYAFIIGCVLLVASLTLESFGIQVSDIFIGVFASMIVGPLVDGTVDRYRSRKAEVEGD